MALARLVVFDCDGTLVDSQHAIVAAMQGAFTAHGLAVPDALAVRRTVGLRLDVAVARVLPADAQDRLADIVAAFRDLATKLRAEADHREPLYPGTREVLENLAAQGIALGVATGKSRRGLIATLEGHGLMSLFTTLKTADDGPGKPHPQILLDAMAETGAGPESTIMIGDTTFDISMAVRARALSIGVAWGYHEVDELVEAGAPRIAGNFADLPDIIAGLWEPQT
jgi:phosphoglycolate phosphatase